MVAVQMMWFLVACVWVGAEIALTRKSMPNAEGSQYDRRSALLLWLACAFGIVVALLFKHWLLLPLPFAYLPRQAGALLLFTVGIGMRFSAIAQLGRFFSSHLVIQEHHRLVEKGLYRWIRHPSYTGLLLALVAAGLAMGDGLALLALVVPTTVAVLYRIELEEALLRHYLHDEYLDYCKRTKRLLPWIY